MRTRRLLVVLALGAVIGFSISGVLVYRAVDVEQAPAADARRRLNDVRARLGGGQPMLTLDDAGNVIRRVEPAARSGRPVRRLAVLAYQAGEERLVAAEVPFWFFKLKAPAAQFLVRGTGLDLRRLGLTAAALERYGPGLLVDHSRPNGDRMLAWTE